MSFKRSRDPRMDPGIHRKANGFDRRLKVQATRCADEKIRRSSSLNAVSETRWRKKVLGAYYRFYGLTSLVLPPVMSSFAIFI